MISSHEAFPNIAVIAWLNPPGEAWSLPVREGLRDDLRAAFDDASVAGIVLVGGGRTFCGGADIREFGTADAAQPPDIVDIGRLIKAGRKPVVAAIAGVALGGGLEIALWAHLRVAAPTARVGLPEVKLGVLPGAGGTQLLPRLIGAEAAIELMTSGRLVDAAEALRLGLIDACDADPVGRAARLAHDSAAGKGSFESTLAGTVALPPGVESGSFFDQAAQSARSSAKGAPAPERIVTCVRDAATLPFEQGLTRERQAFNELVATPEARALQHVFFSERAAARIANLPASTGMRPVETVGIVGAGAMGVGIAMAFADAGFGVIIVDSTAEALARGREHIDEAYASSVTRKRLPQAGADVHLKRLTFTADLAALASADLVIDAVVQEVGVKHEVFRKLDALMRPGAILATNSSFFDVDDIAEQTRRPQDVLGLHFFSLANTMRLLEVVRGARTAPDVLRTAMNVAKRIGKVAVVSRNVDGFIGNRMFERYVSCAYELVADGASTREVDAALENFGMAMGPFAMLDLAGNNTSWINCKGNVAADLTNIYRTGDQVRHDHPDAEKMVTDWRGTKGIAPRHIDAQEIVERCLYALVNEGGHVLDDGVAQRASDIDIVFVAGYGFPALKGGPMHHAEAIGLRQVRDRIAAFAKDDPSGGWTPAAAIEAAVERGRFEPA
jgi:3-hydroxyacyl-CoA dehydrogenase